MATHITGVVRAPDGALLPGRVLLIQRLGAQFYGLGGAAGVAVPRVVTLDGASEIDVTLDAGTYHVATTGPGEAPLSAVFGVPTDTAEAAFGDLLAAAAPPLDNDLVLQVLASAAEALTSKQAAAGSLAASVALQSAVLIRGLSGNHTAELDDAGRLLVFDGTATLTIPAQANADWPVGAVIAAAQVGAAVLTVEGAAGVDLVFRAPALDVTVPRGGAVSLTRVAADTWLVLGDLA